MNEIVYWTLWKNMQYGVQNLPNLDIVHGLILDKWLVLLVTYAKADWIDRIPYAIGLLHQHVTENWSIAKYK